MKVLFTHRYYAPDTPAYANMLRKLAEGLAARTDLDIHVLGSMPSYRGRQSAPRAEVLNGVSVRRQPVFSEKSGIPGVRLVNVILYCAALIWHVGRLRPDVVTASTFPPVLAGWCASLAARIFGGRFIYHMQDVHPEVSQIAGGRLGRGVPFRLLRWLDNQTLRRASAIVVLSEDMADTLRARGLGALPIRVINNFQLDTFGRDGAAPAHLVRPEGRRRVIFAGNLGKFQNMELLVAGVMRELRVRADTDLLLLGDGDAQAALQRRWGDDPQVIFGPFLPFEEASPLIRDADIGLVSLAPGIYRVSYPSKMLTYAALHLPMLALVEPQSHLARTVAAEGLGAVPAAATEDAVSEALAELLDGPDLKKRVAEWDARENTVAGRIDTWASLIDEVAA